MKKNVDLTNCLLGLNFLILIFGQKNCLFKFCQLVNSLSLNFAALVIQLVLQKKVKGQFLDNHPSLEGRYVYCMSLTNNNNCLQQFILSYFQTSVRLQ